MHFFNLKQLRFQPFADAGARWAFLSFALVFGSAVNAQNSGNLRLQIDPPTTFTYKLDHQFTMQQSEVELLEGPHHFSFWAPQRRVVDTTLTITGGVDRSFALRLPFSTEYLVYQRDLKAYKKSMRFQRLVPAVATGGSLIYTAVKYGQMKKAHDLFAEDHAAYDDASSPHAISVLKENVIPAHKDEFDKARTGFQMAAGVTVLFAGATAYMYLRSAKQKKPEFIDKEKLRFDGLSWMPGADGGEWSGGLTWNFSR
ncbi:MAG: hypothetical protein KBF49_10740 [Flavobacteriales bacterium]|nr:hypothetical protein [Flavobacteriales bacterium]